MSFAEMTRLLLAGWSKYVLMIVFGSNVLARMWRSRRIRAQIGQNTLWIASWWITWDRFHFSDWRLTLLQLCKVHIVYWLVDVAITWSCYAIMWCQRNGIVLFACYLMVDDRCIHLPWVESRKQWETCLLLFVLLLIWIYNWNQTYALVPSVVRLILELVMSLLVGNF